MFEIIAWVSIAVGFLVVTIFSLTAMILTRRRDQTGGSFKDAKEQVKRIDEAADAALLEINKTAALVTEEINEKYQSMLFLYNLLEEKKKEILAVNESVTTPRPTQKENKQIRNKPPVVNPKHNEIIQLSEVGFSSAEIAKELGIGQGEVRLILDLAKIN